MSKNMNVQDARLRLEQLKEGHLPPNPELGLPESNTSVIPQWPP